MARKRTLISSPLDWQMHASPVAPPVIPVLAERGGTQLRTPLPVALIDTREQNPLSLQRFKSWFAGVESCALPIGDYSVRGMEDCCVVERKDLADLVHSFAEHREVFIARLRKLAALPHGLLVITAPLSQVKSPYPYGRSDPNQVVQSLVAVVAGLRLPFLCTETHELGEEIVASFLYQSYLYDWLDNNGYGRYLSEQDL